MVFQEISDRKNSVSGREVEIWSRKRWETKSRLWTEGAGSRRPVCRVQVIKYWKVLGEESDGKLDVVNTKHTSCDCDCNFLLIYLPASSEILSLEIWPWHLLNQSIRKASLWWVKTKVWSFEYHWDIYFRISRLEDENAILWYCHPFWSGIRLVGPQQRRRHLLQLRLQHSQEQQYQGNTAHGEEIWKWGKCWMPNWNFPSQDFQVTEDQSLNSRPGELEFHLSQLGTFLTVSPLAATLSGPGAGTLRVQTVSNTMWGSHITLAIPSPGENTQSSVQEDNFLQHFPSRVLTRPQMINDINQIN